jgi:Calcium binding
MARRKLEKDRERLQALIEEATVDSYGEEEQLTGLWTMIEDRVVCPFRAKVIGEEVKVTGLEWNGGEVFYAVCERKGKKHRVDLSSLEWIEPHPEGFEWIEAYCAWREWGG